MKFLIEHTRSLHEILEEYEDVYSIVTQQDDDDDDEQLQEEKNLDAEKKTSQENVFYAGTRTSNN